uniref:Uncharacterized protein n=1 Tax=Anopheles atroparvus TaxID=41427 RepID=A0A182IRD1_ANOAO
MLLLLRVPIRTLAEVHHERSITVDGARLGRGRLLVVAVLNVRWRPSVAGFWRGKIGLFCALIDLASSTRSRLAACPADRYDPCCVLPKRDLLEFLMIEIGSEAMLRRMSDTSLTPSSSIETFVALSSSSSSSPGPALSGSDSGSISIEIGSSREDFPSTFLVTTTFPSASTSDERSPISTMTSSIPSLMVEFSTPAQKFCSGFAPYPKLQPAPEVVEAPVTAPLCRCGHARDSKSTVTLPLLLLLAADSCSCWPGQHPPGASPETLRPNKIRRSRRVFLCRFFSSHSRLIASILFSTNVEKTASN